MKEVRGNTIPQLQSEHDFPSAIRLPLQKRTKKPTLVARDNVHDGYNGTLNGTVQWTTNITIGGQGSFYVTADTGSGKL